MEINRTMIVIENPKSNKPKVYGQEIKSSYDILQAVEEYFEEKDIVIDYESVEKIANALERGTSCWYGRSHYFQIADIYS